MKVTHCRRKKSEEKELENGKSLSKERFNTYFRSFYEFIDNIIKEEIEVLWATRNDDSHKN